MMYDDAPIEFNTPLCEGQSADGIFIEGFGTTTLSQHGRKGLCAWQYKKTLSFIEGRLTETLKVEDLAAEVRMSTGHFARAFSITVGMSPYAFLLKKRLERAQRLMLTPERQLSTIAFECGFSDQAHLSRLFRRFEGTSPGRWRRARLEDATARPEASL